MRDYVDYNKELTTTTGSGRPITTGTATTTTSTIYRHKLGDIDGGSGSSSVNHHSDDKVFY